MTDDTSRLDQMMKVTDAILLKQIGVDGLKQYVQDETEADGSGSSWRKVLSRMKDILQNERHASQ